MDELTLSPGTLATLVCTLEVASPKPGNVHRGADFLDLTLEDFLVSASLLGQAIDEYHDASVGETVLAAIKQTKALVGSNTNLGMALLLVPLAKAIQRRQPADMCDSWFLIPEAIRPIMQDLTAHDTELVFQAIRLANPGGLGTVDKADLNAPTKPSVTLLEAMSLAADRDLIARQYTNGFQEVFGLGVDLLSRGRDVFRKLSDAIVFAHVGLMAAIPDSLIQRKCGLAEARRSQFLAQAAFESLSQPSANGEREWVHVSELDFWLRAKGNQRNPGTTADLIAASLFVAIYNRVIKAPFR